MTVDREPRRGWNRAYDRSDVTLEVPMRFCVYTQGDAEVNTSTTISTPPDGSR